MSHHTTQFYIDGCWVEPAAPRWFDTINPATEQSVSQLALGNKQDVDRAVAAARQAFPSWAETSVSERIALLKRILVGYQRRYNEFAEAIHLEIGSPIKFARDGQAMRGVVHLKALIEVMEHFSFEEQRGSTRLRLEPIGVCGLITPWNWPVNQIAVKTLPALAAGCTMVLKPSEYSPLSALLFAEVLHDAGVPAGVFNLLNGDGISVGAELAAHPDVDMISFTGSTRAGIEVAKLAAPGVKRVAQELGGKSANLLLDDADLETSVPRAVAACFTNSGQSCSIPTRLLVPRSLLNKVNVIAQQAACQYHAGTGDDGATQLGPLVNRMQFDRVQQLIQRGIEENAELLIGGTGKPDGITNGYYVKPTIFSQVTPDMTIAREEIFGPVLCIMPYDDEQQAISMANDSNYGLAAYVQSASLDRARMVARCLRAGQVHINYPPVDFHAPFGGYRHSGNGREWGEAGLREYLEMKAIVGYQPI